MTKKSQKLHEAIHHILPMVANESELKPYHEDLDLLWQEDFGGLLRLYSATTQAKKINLDGSRETVKHTVQGIGVIATNTAGVNSLYLYEPDGKEPRHEGAWDSVIILGDPIKDNTKYLVVGIDNALALYRDRMADGGGACILAIPTMTKGAVRQVLDQVIPAFAPKYVISPAHNPYELSENEHSTLVFISGDLSVMLSDDVAFESILGDSDTELVEPTGWGELLPLVDDSTTANPYPTHAFLAFAPAVERIAYHAQVPPSLAGQMVLSCLSTLFQPYVKAPFMHTHISASVWTLTQADSGAGKTRTMSLAHKAIRDFVKQSEKEYKEQLAEWQAGKAQAEADKSLAQYLEDSPRPTKSANFDVVDEATREALLDDFVLDGAKNRTVSTDEGAVFFGGYSMQGDTRINTIGSLVKLYESGIASRKLATKRGGGEIFTEVAYDCSLTLDISAQDVILKPVLNDPTLSKQGFLARFLFSAEPSLRGKRDFSSEERLNSNPYHDEHLQGFWAVCEAVLSDPHKIFNAVNAKTAEYDDVGRYMVPYANKDVKRLAGAKQQLIEDKLGYGGEFERFYPFAERVAGNMHKIATLLAVGMRSSVVDVEHIEAGYELALYSLHELIRVSKNPTNKGETKAELLLEWLINQADDKGMVAKTYTAQNAPYSLRAKGVLEGVLEHLEHCNYLRIQTAKTQGRGNAKIWIVLNPTIV